MFRVLCPLWSTICSVVAGVILLLLLYGIELKNSKTFESLLDNGIVWPPADFWLRAALFAFVLRVIYMKFKTTHTHTHKRTSLAKHIHISTFAHV